MSWVFWNNLLFFGQNMSEMCQAVPELMTYLLMWRQMCQFPKGRAVVTRRLIPIACDGGRPASSSVPVLERSREMLDQAFDIGMAVFRCVSF